MSKAGVWDKLSTPATQTKLAVPPHYCKNKNDDGYHIEGTDIPFDPDTYDEADYTLWIDND